MYRMARGSDAWVCVVGCFVTAQCGTVPSSWGLSETAREGHADDIGSMLCDPRDMLSVGATPQGYGELGWGWRSGVEEDPMTGVFAG